MTNHTTFPDAIVFPDGTIRLVTAAAKSWTYRKTNINGSCKANTIPDYVDSDDSIPQIMEDDGFVIRHERQPAFHYRSKRRSWPKYTMSDDTKVIDFLQRIPKECRDDAMFRADGRHRQRNHRMQLARKQKLRDNPQE